jgi:ribonuclease-3
MTLHLLEEKIGYTFKNKTLLEHALTHSSYANEHKLDMGSNERLEFLGDSVLGFIAAEYFYQNFPDKAEGQLTTCRSNAVCETALCEYARSFNLGSSLRMGRGELGGGGANRPSILADAFEALLAAIFLDGGIEAAKAFALPFLKKCKAKPIADSKTKLQQIVQQSPDENITYALVEESGPDHDKNFIVEVRISNNVKGVGEGRNKKLAEQAAAHEALKSMGY